MKQTNFIRQLQLNRNNEVPKITSIYYVPESHESITTNNNNETHIFISDAFPDCPIDFINYQRIKNQLSFNESENDNSKDIEINFNIVNKLTVDIFPNPTNGIINFYIQNPLQGNVKLEISNLIGEIVWYAQTNQNNYLVNFENHSKGIYMVHFSNEQQVITKKLIIN